MKRLLSIFAVVLLSIGLFAMGTQGEFQSVDNKIATDNDNVPKDRRDPPPVFSQLQNLDSTVA